MKYKLILLLMVLGTFLLQTTIMQSFSSLLVRPELMLILVVSFGFMRGKKSGMLTGFFAGLLMDLFYGEFFGLTALLYMYIGFLNGFGYKVFFDEDVKAPMLLTAVSCFGYRMALGLIRFLLGDTFSFGLFVRSEVLPITISTVLCSLFFYKLYYIINKKLVANELEEQQSPWLR